MRALGDMTRLWAKIGIARFFARFFTLTWIMVSDSREFGLTGDMLFCCRDPYDCSVKKCLNAEFWGRLLYLVCYFFMSNMREIDFFNFISAVLCLVEFATVCTKRSISVSCCFAFDFLLRRIEGLIIILGCILPI